jgi:uroporphyrinogen III methyltransferase/synthase
LLDYARQGKTVVRLKGGDPTIFARGFEEAAALRQAGIDYEIVPGVTSALAASAYTEIPLTHRAVASAVALVTGHDQVVDASQPLDWPALARFPGTLAIYMGMKRLPEIVQTLLDNGKSPTTPAAVVQWASTNRQATLSTSLADLPTEVARRQMSAPAVVLIGPVVDCRPERSWFDKRPLLGQCIVVTRPRHQAERLQRDLEERGAEVRQLPGIEIHDPPDWRPVDDKLDRLGEYDWLVFTSGNGVDAFLRRLEARGQDLRSLGRVKLAAIGPATAEALRSWHLRADVVPPRFDSETLAATLMPKVARQRVLLARADRGREVLQLELSRVAEVEQVAVYSQIDVPDLDADSVAALQRGEVTWLTFTSSNIARSILTRLPVEAQQHLHSGTIRIATISRVTTQAVESLGYRVSVEAEEATTAGLVAAIERAVRSAKFPESRSGKVDENTAGQ